MRIFLIFILIFSSTVAFAQTKKLRWSMEICEYEGTYNAKKYSEKQLRDTLKLIEHASYRIGLNATPFGIEEVNRLRVADLDKEYNQHLSDIKSLALVKSPYWEAARQKKLSELEQVYRLSRTTMLAYDKPAMLKEYKFADSCVRKYANPLINGGDELLTIWLEVNQAARRRNSFPENVRNTYELQTRSPNKYKYAQLEVMTFGWWNCANEFIKYVEDNNSYEREFKKLFTRVKTIGCDEP